MVESTNEICESVKIGRKKPKYELWNYEVKATMIKTDVGKYLKWKRKRLIYILPGLPGLL